MSRYKRSKDIDNERERLSLLATIANADAERFFKKLEFDPANIRTIIDLGCGSGEAFPLLAKIFYQGEITGFDASAEMLDRASEWEIAEDLIVGDLRKLSTIPEIKKQKFDLAYLRTVFMHLPDAEQVLLSIIPIVSEKGVVIAQEPDWSTAKAEFSEFKIFKGALLEMMQENGIKPFMGRQLSDLFTNIGLREIKEERYITEIHPDMPTWNLLFYMLDVAGERLLPFLRKRGIDSVGGMRKLLKNAKKEEANFFTSPAYVLAAGWK